MPIYNEEFIKSVTENYPNSCEKIIDAYKFAYDAHDGILRKSGEPYIIHPVSVAQILIDNNMDYPTIIAGLLHDVVEDTKFSSDDIKERYGETVAKLVEGVTKIDEMTAQANNLTESDSIKKLLLAMAEDIRIIFIKLADRLHNMRTIEFLKPEKQKNMATETQELFIPIAERIGVRKIRSELQALVFKCLHPAEYDKIKAELDQKLKNQEKDLELLEKEIKMILVHNRVQAEIVSLPQNYFSIYKKMQGQGINKIYGLKSFKIITQTELDCYKILGLLHRAYTPIPSQIKDYIASPKANGYQSLNSALIAKGSDITFNIMIRTKQMDNNCEFGVSSLWRNKDNDKKYEDKFEKHNELKKIILGEKGFSQSSDEFISVIKSDLMTYMTWVFTPEHKPIRISVKNPTAIDFAYIVHSDIGNNAVSAIINGNKMPLETELKNGDEVEIIVSKTNKAPSREWLTFLKTSYARKKIREFFKRHTNQKSIEKGKMILAKKLAIVSKTLAELVVNFDEVRPEFNFVSLDDMYASSSLDSELADKLVDYILKKDELRLAVKHSPVKIENSDDVVSIDISNCCGAVVGDPIVGILSKNGVAVHHANCKNLLSVGKANLISASWKEGINTLLETSIKVICKDVVGAIATICETIASHDIDIKKVTAKTQNSDEGELEISLKVENLKQLEKILEDLGQLKIVKSVVRKIDEQ